MEKLHDIKSQNFINRVLGGHVYFENTSTQKFSEKHLTILQSLVKSVLSSLQMEDAIIKVDLSSSAAIDGSQGEAYRLGKNSKGTAAYGFSMKAKLLKDIMDSDGRVDRRELKEAAETIAHELVHCKQYHEGWLVESNAGDLWKGKLQDEKGKYYEDMQYRKRPWEVMAFAAQESLAKAAIQDLIGQSIISAEEGMYIPRTESEKARVALYEIRRAEKAEKLRLQAP